MRDGTLPNKEEPFQTRKNLFKQGRTFPNKGNTFKQGKYLPNKGNKGNTFQIREKPFQTRKNTNKQEKTFQARERLSSKGYLPIKCKRLQVVGVSGQGKAVVSDGGYGVIGG